MIELILISKRYFTKEKCINIDLITIIIYIKI